METQEMMTMDLGRAKARAKKAMKTRATVPKFYVLRSTLDWENLER